MFRIGQPTSDATRRFLQTLADREFSYADVGLTRTGAAPQGYFVNRWREEIGTGEAAYLRAQAALGQWGMFEIPWAQAMADAGPVSTGQNVAIYAGKAGAWVLVGCRVVYTVDECDGPIVRFGFANGTLVDHVVAGEERFLVEWNRETDQVVYDLFSFSWPNHFVSQCGYPVLWRLQQRFAQDSAKALARAAQHESHVAQPQT